MTNEYLIQFCNLTTPAERSEHKIKVGFMLRELISAKALTDEGFGLEHTTGSLRPQSAFKICNNLFKSGHLFKATLNFHGSTRVRYFATPELAASFQLKQKIIADNKPPRVRKKAKIKIKKVIVLKPLPALKTNLLKLPNSAQAKIIWPESVKVFIAQPMLQRFSLIEPLSFQHGGTHAMK